jgi:hypothetical protein
MVDLKPKYRIPATRLPFVNGEIAQVEYQGQSCLVSAIWGGALGGRLFFWNPVNGFHAMRELPKGVPGAYMLKTAVDGRLYIGDGNGDLHRYDPKADRFEALVTGLMHSITWGGCVTDRYAVWSASPGEAVVYDWREGKVVKELKPADVDEPHARYAHNVPEAPDGKVLLCLDVPQARVVVLDPKDMTTRSVTPEGMRGIGSTLAAHFVDGKTLVLIVADGAKVVSYPDFKLIADVPTPGGVELTNFRGCFVGGRFYAVPMKPFGGLVRFDTGARNWTLLSENWTGGDAAYLGIFKDAGGRERICGITVRGIALLLDPTTMKTTTLDVESTGQLDAHAMCVAPDAGVIVGAPFINASFWTIDMKTGRGEDRGRGMPGGGQINQIVWDAGRHKALMSAYTAASISEYDPFKGGRWPENPRPVASAKAQGQMRPTGLAFDRRYAWMATSPEYGQLGGALSRVDPETGEIRVWRNLVPDQKVNALVMDAKRRRIYFSTEIFGDMDSAVTTQKTGEVAAFDMNELRLIKRQVVRDGVPGCGAVCLLPDGRLLLRIGNEQLAWDCDAGKVESLGELPEAVSAVTTDEDGTVWATVGDQIGRVEVVGGKVRFVPVVPMRGGFVQIVGGVMYWVTGADVYAVPMEDLRRMG